MLSFDDAHVEQFTIASPILDKYGFKAVFFIPSNYIAKKKLLGRCTNKKIVGPGPYDRRSRL
jgi:peptidoglycan/xylan/chitin deacetylase (PgdA/CDA1 family)